MANDVFELGRDTRGEVIGRERSETALASATDFDYPFQEMAVRYCWGEVWNRPGLDRKTRSIINLAMLSAMGRASELASHVRGALTNGVSEEEMREVFMQVCIYAGVPAAGEAFKIAKDAITEAKKV
ncbi:carboxymuconolactone decarboxylase family protein [Rhizobium sp. PRIMUS64]|uniref:carboxymuconolactone decarboxylase family protein n=1 Tax=Rhizobium sp. PRIMUS64 TaxID=2908925 RepID=UPI001FF63B4C|nr:carboxymuconolactone decarboxylase family protein [Rhizobium sp. PRIMUS64]MCJ9690553.1 carboxymuconolactone decarboxylase family protein [Rhizobium sp. PRIMUS64]